MVTVPLADRLDIQELAANYAYYCDTRRYAEVDSVFAEDGVFDETVIGLPLCKGRTAIRDFFCGVDPVVQFIIHINGNHRIASYDGTRASGTCHLHAEGRFNGRDVRIFGYYADDYVKIDGRWSIQRRQLIEIAPSTGFA